MRNRIRTAGISIALCAALVLGGLGITGRTAFAEGPVVSEINGVALTQRAAEQGVYKEGGLIINRFEATGSVTATADITDFTYIMLEYYNPTGAAWPFVFKIQDTTPVQTYTTESTVPYKRLDTAFEEVSEATTTGYLAPGVSTAGWLVFPRGIFRDIETFGTTLAAIYLLLPCTAVNQDGVTALHFGRIKALFGTDTFNGGTVISNTALWDDGDFAPRTVASTGGADGGALVSVERCAIPTVTPPIVCDFGDVRILEDFDTGYPADETTYNAALNAKAYDAVRGINVGRYAAASAEGNALRFNIVAPREDRPDDYGVITLTPKTAVYKWSHWANDGGEAEGLTFWVKNLSPVPVGIGFQLDEYDPDQNVSEDYRGERWTLGYGTRILLLETATQKQFMVQAGDNFNIPAGFEGWARIPFSAFEKAWWCSWGNDTLDLVRIPQFGISFNTVVNMGLSFALDSIGVYYNKTSVKSLFRNNGSSIAENMEG
ncbi:hypothetical protein FACS1894211_13870 [Clostridia bacterium]|nr:hypothetical protein FACS1894211_13870 [Clostridia bacterium]